MKKAKEILLLVGGILQIVCAVSLAIAGIVFAVISGLKDFIVEGLENGTINSDLPGSVEEVAAAIGIIFITVAVVFFIIAIFSVVGAIVSFKARFSDSKKALILAIVFGVLSCTEVSAVGGIFGLISMNKQPEPQPEPKQAASEWEPAE